MICQQCGFTSDTNEDRCPRCGAEKDAPAPVPPSTESFYTNPIPSAIPIPSPTPASPYATQYPDAVPNDSGTGPQAVLPPELKGFNFGALLLTFIWGISNSVLVSLLTLVPLLGLIMPFVLGFKGNEWAWQKRKWQSIEHFKATQKTWAYWGLGSFIGCGWFPALILAAILFPVFARARENARRSTCQTHLKEISLAMMIYQQDYDERFPPARIGGAGITAGGNGTPYGWADAISIYTKTPAVFQCPSEMTPAGQSPTQAGYTDYLFNSKLGKTSAQKLPNPAITYTIADGYGDRQVSDASYSEAFDADGAPNGNPVHFDGLNYAYADGHIKWHRYLGPAPSPPIPPSSP